MLSEREAGEPLASPVQAHLAACPACRAEAAGLEAVGPLVERALGAGPIALPSFPARRAFPRWATAAAVLLLAGAWALHRKPVSLPVPPDRAPRPAQGVLESGEAAELAGGVLLEAAPGGLLEFSAGRLSLRRGACWVDTAAPLELTAPLPARIAAGSRVEIRIAEPAMSAWFWRDAEAAGSPETVVSVLAGEVAVKDLRVTAGQRARIAGETTLESLAAPDLAAIERWRAQRIAAGASRRYTPGEIVAMSARARLEGDAAVLEASPQDTALASLPCAGGPVILAAELRGVKGNLLLRYPAPGGTGETLLGDLEAWKGGGWKTLCVQAGGGRVEVFLDGRSLLRVPARAAGAGAPALALGVRGGSVAIRSLAVGEGP